jgi:hypothetical protein
MLTSNLDNFRDENPPHRSGNVKKINCGKYRSDTFNRIAKAHVPFGEIELLASASQPPTSPKGAEKAIPTCDRACDLENDASPPETFCGSGR